MTMIGCEEGSDGYYEDFELLIELLGEALFDFFMYRMVEAVKPSTHYQGWKDCTSRITQTFLQMHKGEVTAEKRQILINHVEVSLKQMAIKIESQDTAAKKKAFCEHLHSKNAGLPAGI